MLDFELLRAFVAVVECGGFHRAAERLNLTQSTVSQQIKRLELETKRPLFRRTTRSVALTDDGEMLLGDARRLLQLDEAARHRLAAPRLSGTLRLGVVDDAASRSPSTGPGLAGGGEGALAGPAITPRPASAVIAGLRILGLEAGLPRLPDLEFAIYEKARHEKAAAALAAALLALGQSPARPTI